MFWRVGFEPKSEKQSIRYCNYYDVLPNKYIIILNKINTIYYINRQNIYKYYYYYTK